MKNRFDYQHILLGLLATLILAGLFYLPYLAVRSKTIDAFRVQQSLLAQQAGAGLQEYFATYDKALDYLVQQPSIQQLDDTGTTLLHDFLSVRRGDILSIQRLDANGSTLFTVPEGVMTARNGASAHCLAIQGERQPKASETYRGEDGGEYLFLSAVVRREGGFDGCLSFSLPVAQVAQRHLGQISLAHNGQMLLLSRGGSILAAPEASLVGKNIHPLITEGDDTEQLRMALASVEPVIVTLGHDLFEGKNRNHGAVYAVVHPLYLAGDSQWSLVVLAPEKEVLGAMAEFRSQWLVVTAVAVTIVGLLSVLLSRIVARRKEEQHQRAAQEQLAGLLDLAPVGVFVLNTTAKVLYANQEALRIVAASAEQTIGRNFLDFLHRDSRQELIEQLASTAVAPTGYQSGPVQFLPFSGAIRDIVFTASLYQVHPQRQWILIVRDVTDERAMAAQQYRLTAAVNQVKEAVLIADRQGSIDYVNAALVEMTGFSEEECRGQMVQMLWATEQDAYFDQKIDDVVHAGEVWRGRIVNQRKDGTLFVAAATVSPMRNDNGTVSHYVVVQRDITHEVEVESRMRQAQKMEAIGTLAGGIAHDFNNILGGIIGFTDLALLMSSPGTEVHNNLLHIRQGGKRAADLVQQILTFSRQSVIEKVPVSMTPLIKESLQLLRASLPATIDIVQDLAVSEVKVMAAPVQIQQIIMNLCTNAFYAMRETGGRLVIRLKQATPDNRSPINGNVHTNWAILMVEDTGQGIDAEILPRIFTPFFTTKQPGEGTGMGLSVVHGIVQELGGQISVQSEPGTGTVFTVLLPLADQEKHSVLTSGEEPLSIGKEHILIVDDEKEIRETCRMMLSHLGYTVTTTGSPQEVLFLMEHAQPPIDLVITDQTMPKMTGVELTRELRRQRPDVPVILCTGYSDRLNYDIAREAGACDLLMKPMDLRGLSGAVRSALDMNVVRKPNGGQGEV
jgi:PAS domain S-box-containing protein